MRGRIEAWRGCKESNLGLKFWRLSRCHYATPTSFVRSFPLSPHPLVFAGLCGLSHRRPVDAFPIPQSNRQRNPPCTCSLPLSACKPILSRSNAGLPYGAWSKHQRPAWLCWPERVASGRKPTQQGSSAPTIAVADPCQQLSPCLIGGGFLRCGRLLVVAAFLPRLI